ncbi:MAG: FHA domain-containing protein [Ilumatobacteraceae bacterium]
MPGSALAAELAERIGTSGAALATVGPPDSLSPTPAIAVDVVVRGPDGSTVSVEQRTVTIGRRSSAAAVDLAVDDPTVSRRHVSVWRAGGATLCRDLGSRNGTIRRRDGDEHAVPAAPGGPTLLLPGDELVTSTGTLLAIVADSC